MKTPFVLFFLSFLIFGSLQAAPDPFFKAGALFKEQNWTEARDAYDAVRKNETDWHSANTRDAVEGAVACDVKLQLWEDAITRMEEFIFKTQGSFEEAVGRRFLAGLYLTFPHQGVKQGGQFLRGKSGQGVYVTSWKKDRRAAVENYEKARARLISLKDSSEKSTAEWIGIDFDLAAALAAQDDSFYGGRWGICGWWWDSWFADEEDSEAVEEADYEEPRYGRGRYGQNQETPTGIPLGPDGQPQFVATPENYSAELGAGPKIRWLLAEIQRLDTSDKKEDAAKALFRSAMIARSLYGPEIIQQLQQNQTRYNRMGRPLPVESNPDAAKEKIWQLTDDQVMTLAGGRLQVVTLPAEENPLALLRSVAGKYPASSLLPEAEYAVALYLQTRQQFPEAVAAYQELIEKYPDHKRAVDAKAQIASIQQANILLGETGVCLPDETPKLAFTYRNTDKISFKAIRFDMAKYVADELTRKKDDYWNFRNLAFNLFQENRWGKYLREPAGEWSESVQRDETGRVAESSTLAPLTANGAYIVEARTAGQDTVSRVLLLVTDIAIVQKNVKDAGLIYICDARNGQPLPEKAVRIYEHWTNYDKVRKKQVTRFDSVTLTTDAEGVVKYKRKHSDQGSQVEGVVNGGDNRLAVTFFQGWNEGQYVQGDYLENGERDYVVTDRPVYRPGSTVKYRIWQRRMTNRVYQKPQAGTITVEIWDAKNNRMKSDYLKTDDNGGASGEFLLGEEPPLGVWSIRVNSNRPDARRLAGGVFRVEEYKKPEFEVKVKPGSTQVRLGEKFKAAISARYYFGAPVARAKVSYKVFRENYDHVYLGSGEYDWLYGKGYGHYRYAYSWFPWWGRWGGFICREGIWPRPFRPSYQFPWGSYGDDENWSRRMEGGPRNALRELVAQGTADLKPDGTYEVEVDTAQAKATRGDHDHRYTIEAEVRDASRRTIEGKGEVIVTRQEFYVFVDTDGGWYEPKNDVFVEVRALTPDNMPVAAKGEVVILRVSYSGADNNTVSEQEVKRWDAETNADGRLSFKWPVTGDGQWRITFRTRDSWKQEVLGNAVFWSRGPKFDGRVYRFNDLEMIADKRSYKVGETAHLLVNVAENNSRILFSDNVTRGSLLNYRFIDIPQRSMVIDLPIEENRVPNFFVEATLVRNGRVHSESRELFVPPVHGLLNVTVKTDRQVYKPGEKGTVHVEATDAEGKPVAGDVALTAFDEAVTYIQEEFGPSPQVFFTDKNVIIRCRSIRPRSIFSIRPD